MTMALHFSGFMYNSFYRTMIEDNEARKFIDTFVGPSVTMASILRIARNATFSLITRIALCFFLPLTREATIKAYTNPKFFTVLKNTVFNEVYLHQRIWRHVFENGCGMIGLSTYYILFKIRKAYFDPPAEKKKPEGSTTPAPKGTNSTAATAATKKPGYKRKDEAYYNNYNNYYYNDNEDSVYSYQNYQPDTNDNNINNNPLYGYVPINEKNDAFYGYQPPVYGYEEPSYSGSNQPSYPFKANSEEPKVDANFLNSFKTVLTKIKGLGDSNAWAPVSS